MSRFEQAPESQRNLPPRMATNSPMHTLVVYDGWMGGAGGVSHDLFVRMNRELRKGETYSVAEVVEVDGKNLVVLNEVSGKWPISFFAAYK